MSYLDVAVESEKSRTAAYSKALIDLSDYFISLYRKFIFYQQTCKFNPIFPKIIFYKLKVLKIFLVKIN